MKTMLIVASIAALVVCAYLIGQASTSSTNVASPLPVHQEPLDIAIRDMRTGESITFGEFIDRLMEHGVIAVGESHDQELHHRVQLQIIKSLYARDGRLGVGMEMFQRPYQDVVDRYMRGEISEQEFLDQTEYITRWGYPWELYRDIVEFSRLNGIPVGALNAAAELIQRVKQVGYDGLTDAEKKELGPVDFQLKEHRDFWLPILNHMHGNRTPTAQEKERSYQIMTIWDDYMAQSAANLLRDRQLERIVVVAGIGHVEGGFGIPDRAAAYSGKSSATIAIVVGGVNDEGPMLPVDFVVCVNPDQATSGPCGQ